MIILIILLVITIFIFVYIAIHKKDDIRYIKSSGHYGVVKNRKPLKPKSKVIEMSTKETSQGKSNIPMKQNVNPNDSRPGYIIPRVKNVYKKDMKEKMHDFYLTKEDRKTTDEIYNKHVKNIRIAKRNKKRNKRIKQKKQK